MVDDDPNFKPAFLDPERAASIPYQGGEAGIDVTPKFDEELAAENDPAYVAEQKIEVEPHVGGKGPSRGYIERWRAIARYTALGWKPTQIGAKLNYSPTAVSLALKSEWVQSEIRRYREMLETDITHQVKEAAKDGASYIHTLINNEAAKDRDRLDAAKWSVEKTTGKAKQEIGVESNTLTAFMDLVRDMQRNGEPIDVTPKQIQPPSDDTIVEVRPESDRFAAFLGDNL